LGKIILKTPDGKKVVVDIKGDVLLYDAPQNPPNTGTRFTSGTDLYAHKARSGKVYFYSYFWSMWEGTDSSYKLLTEDEAKEFILDNAGIADHVAAGIKWERVKEYFPDIDEETA